MAGDIYYQLLSENKQYKVKIDSQFILISELKRRICEDLGHKEELGIYKDQDLQREYADNEKISVHTSVLVERKQNTVNSYGNNKFLKCDKCGGQNPQKTLCCNKKICKNCKDDSKRIGKCIFCGLTQQQSEKQLQMKNESLRKIKENLNFPPEREYVKYLENARFFFIKSCNQENISFALQNSIWATTLKNQVNQSDNLRFLFEAFHNCLNVILIFGVNKTNYFQGVAKMQQLNDGSNSKPPWKNNDAIKLGESFLIRWLRVEDLNYSVCSDLKNAICNNEPLTSKPKDCQEIDAENGKKLCMRFQSDQEYESLYQNHYTPSIQQSVQHEQPNSFKNNSNQIIPQINDGNSNLYNQQQQQLQQQIESNTNEGKYSNNTFIQQQQLVSTQQSNENQISDSNQKEGQIESKVLSEFIKQYNQALELTEGDFFSIIEELHQIRELKIKQEQEQVSQSSQIQQEEQEEQQQETFEVEEEIDNQDSNKDKQEQQSLPKEETHDNQEEYQDYSNNEEIIEEKSKQTESPSQKEADDQSQKRESSNSFNEKQSESDNNKSNYPKKDSTYKAKVEDTFTKPPITAFSKIPPHPLIPGMNPTMAGMNPTIPAMNYNFNPFFMPQMQMMGIGGMSLNPGFLRQGNLGMGDNSMMNMNMVGMGMNLLNNGGGVYDKKNKHQANEYHEQKDKKNKQDGKDFNHLREKQENDNDRDGSNSSSSREDYSKKNQIRHHRDTSPSNQSSKTHQNSLRSNYPSKQSHNISNRNNNYNKGQRYNPQRSNQNLDDYDNDDSLRGGNRDKVRNKSRERKEGRRREKDRSNSINDNNNNYSNRYKRRSDSAQRKKRDRK